MKDSFKLSIITVIIMLSSCSQNRFIVAPPYTDVGKISALKKGMSLPEVNTTLGISPFNVYMSDNGTSIYTYNYRLRERRIPINNFGTFIDRPGDPSDKSIYSEESQKFGSDFYTEPKLLYISFKEDKMQSVITEDGLQHATTVVAISGNLTEIIKDPQFKILPDNLLKDNVVLPVDEKGNYMPNNGAGTNQSGVLSPGFIYFGGNSTGVSAIPNTYPRFIGSKESRKPLFNFLKKKENEGSR